MTDEDGGVGDYRVDDGNRPDALGFYGQTPCQQVKANLPIENEVNVKNDAGIGIPRGS